MPPKKIDYADVVKSHCRDSLCSNCKLHVSNGSNWCETHPFASCTEQDYIDAYNIINGAEEGTHGNPVDHPDHYNQGEIECIDAMIAAFGKEKVCDWCVMTSFKYHWRYQHKNGDEDICKASWYIDKYKELKELGS